jgi:hypothetical protein
MQTIVKTTEPHDLLALVPQLVGFLPQNSVVLVAFRGKRTCGAYRVDLPAPASDPVYRRMATTLIGMLCKVRGADGVVPVVYTDDRFDECGGIPRQTFATRVIERARTAGFTVGDALCVAADGWGSYFDDTDAAGRARPLALIDESVVHMAVPQGDRSALVSPRERAVLPASDLASRERVARAIDRLRAADETDDEASESIGDEWEEPVVFAEAVLNLDGASMPPELAAHVILMAELPSLRDVLLFEWAWGREIGLRTYRMNLRHARGELIMAEDDGALGLAGIGMPTPDPERIARAIELLKSLAACAPKTVRAPLLTMLAWLNWALGLGSTAGLFIEHARAIDPRYGLAELLDSMLHNGMLPEWAFAQPDVDPDQRVVTIEAGESR